MHSPHPAAGFTFTTNGQPASAGPASVPSQSKPSQPMVTIRRVQNPTGADEPLVTISMKDRQPPQGPNKSSATAGKDKLLYTLVNGQVKKVPDAGIDLIPGVTEDDEKLSKKQKKKLKRQLSKEQADQAAPVLAPAAVAGVLRRPEPRVPPTGQPPAPLPVNGRGRLDLDRLSLPPGISISKIQGEVPERKYFPSRAEPPPPTPVVVPSAALLGGLPQGYGGGPGGLANPAHVINPVGGGRGFPANGEGIWF